MTSSALTASDQPLVERYDGLILDLDGVLQLDDQPVPGAVDVMGKVRSTGVPVVFLTNNAARTPSEVAARLQGIGFEAADGQVLTSAMVAAELLASRLPARTDVLVVGGPGLIEAVASVGLCPVTVASEGVAAVVQGWGPDVGWALLAEGSVALRAGAAWVATNADRTLPSPRGPLPGNGSLVSALQTATGLQPEVVGKPQRGMFDVAASRAGGERPLMVGDRLDTDIAGAIAAGLPALLVLTGVASARDVLAAAPAERPTYIGLDLHALMQAHGAPELSGDCATCGEVTVAGDGTVTGLADPASADDDTRTNGLRAAAALAWAEVLPKTEYDAVLRRLGFEADV